MQWPVLTLLYTRLVRNVIDSSLPPDSYRGSIIAITNSYIGTLKIAQLHMENSSA